MGGTSTDVALCKRGGLRMTNEPRWPASGCGFSMDIHTEGAGGGSIARVDEGGHGVGPESAAPIPAGLLWQITFADSYRCACRLGHFGGAGLLGGRFPS